MDEFNIEMLKREGYTVDEIDYIKSQGINKIELSEDPMKNNPMRKDKSVYFIDKDGNKNRLSNIMLGYNKHNIKLPNGELFNNKELEEAITNELNNKTPEQFYICKKNGKKVDVDVIVKEVIKEARNHGAVIYSNPRYVSNQNVMSVSIKGEGSQTTKSAGMVFLGKDKIKLPCGEYISLEDINKALHNYLILKPKEKKSPELVDSPPLIFSQPEYEEPYTDQKQEPIPDIGQRIIPDKQLIEELEKENNNNTFFVTVKRKIILPALLISSLIMAATGINVDRVNAFTNANYIVDNTSVSQTYETKDEITERTTSEIKLGKEVYIKDGVKYHESSDYNHGGANNTGVIGNGLRDANDYTITHISVLYNGVIQKSVSNGNKNAYNLMKEVAEKLNVDIDSLDLMIHIGGPVTGWISAKDLLSKEDLTPKIISEKTIVDKTYKGEQELTDGTVSINTGDGIVKLDVLDQNGNVIKNGTVIKGSDGKTYKINNISITHAEAKTNVTFDWNKYAKNTALATAAVALLAVARKKIEEDEIEEEAIIDENDKPNITYPDGPRSEKRKIIPKTVYNLTSDPKIVSGKHIGKHINTTKEIYVTVKNAQERYKRKSKWERIKIKAKGVSPDWYVILKRLNNDSLTKEEVNNMYKEDKYGTGRKI